MNFSVMMMMGNMALRESKLSSWETGYPCSQACEITFVKTVVFLHAVNLNKEVAVKEATGNLKNN